MQTQTTELKSKNKRTSKRFRRGYNAQHCLMTLIEKWKKSVDNGGTFGALFADLSKAFDCLSHELLIAKLDTYGFDRNALKLVNSYKWLSYKWLENPWKLLPFRTEKY